MAKEIIIKTTIDTANSSKSVKELRDSIKQLKNLSLEIGDSSSKDFKDVANAIGKAQDKIEDLRDELVAFKGSGLEKFNATLQVTKEKLGNLEFDEVGKQFKALGQIIAENPFIFLAKIIIELVEHFDELKKAGGFVGETFIAIGNIINGLIQTAKDLADALGLTGFAAQKAADMQIAANKQAQESITERYDTEIKLAEASGESTYLIERKKLLVLIELNKEKIDVVKDYNNQIAILDAKESKSNKDKEEEKTKQLKEEQKKRDEIIKADKKAAKKFQDEQLDAVKKDGLKIVEDKKETQSQLSRIDLDGFEKGQAEIKKRKEQIILDDKKAKDDKIQIANAEAEAANIAALAGIDFVQNNANRETQIALDKIEKKKAAIDDGANYEISRLDNAVQKGLLSEQDAQMRKNEIDKVAQKNKENLDKEQAELQKKAFEREKKANIAKILINAAVEAAKITGIISTYVAGVVTAPLAAAGISQLILLGASTAAQVGIIASQKPAFARGGFVSGAGTSTSDSINASLSNGEFVVNAAATNAFAPLLEAINNLGNSKQLNSSSANSIVSPQQSNQPVRAYVVESEISNNQKNINRIIDRNTFNK